MAWSSSFSWTQAAAAAAGNGGGGGGGWGNQLLPAPGSATICLVSQAITWCGRQYGITTHCTAI